VRALGSLRGQNSIFQALVGTTTDGGASWAFQPFYFDGNEGGANDVFFLDQNTVLFQKASLTGGVQLQEPPTPG